MGILEDAVTEYNARAVEKADALTQEQKQAISDRHRLRQHQEDVDKSVSAFIGLFQERIREMSRVGGPDFPEVKQVGGGDTKFHGTDLRSSIGLTYALCPDGIYSGRDTLTFSGRPEEGIAEATMPGASVDMGGGNRGPGLARKLGTVAFADANQDWIDTMLSEWLDRSDP